jgi:hypothetical protein
VLNIATGKSHSFNRVAELVADQFDEPIRIQKNERSNLITHKHFDITNLLKAFPSLCLTDLEDGLKLYQVHKLEN